MSIRFDIKASHGWRNFERKTIDITVVDSVGAPVNLTGKALSWRLSREAGSSTTLLGKTSTITVTGAQNNIARITIELADYGAALVRPGIWYHELWNDTDDLLLSYGDAWVLPAAAPVTP